MESRAQRKALTQQYKETQHPMGVFCIRNTQNGKLFIGSNANLPAIMNRHRAQLRMNVHMTTSLQNDWNTMGPDAFQFEVLDTLKPPPDNPDYNPYEDLQALLAMWMEKLQPYGDAGYHK